MSSARDSAAPYLPFDGGRFRLMMGLMALPVAQWFEVDGNLAADLGAKRRLLAERHGEVFAATPAAETPAAELLALMAEHLPRHHPEVFRGDGDHLVNTATGERWDLRDSALHPLDFAGRLVQEDLCLLVAEEDAPYRLVGATLCSPARWRLADKIGRPLADIHAPVPGYAAALERPVDRFFFRLAAERPVWRLNWGIVDDPAPFQPEARPMAPLAAEAAGERLFLRVERQTLRRLPTTGAVVFTIRTHVTRLDRAVRTPATAAELAAAIRAMPETTAQYKQIAPIAPALLAWLDARAAA
jgi:hypothetical protein